MTPAAVNSMTNFAGRIARNVVGSAIDVDIDEDMADMFSGRIARTVVGLAIKGNGDESEEDGGDDGDGKDVPLTSMFKGRRIARGIVGLAINGDGDESD